MDHCVESAGVRVGRRIGVCVDASSTPGQSDVRKKYKKNLRQVPHT